MSTPPPRIVHSSIASLATTQQGAATMLQLRGIGLSADAVQRRVRSGQYVRAARGVFGVGHLPDSPLTDWSVAVLQAGPDAALSHLAAARLHGLIAWEPRRIDVTTPTWHRPVRGVVRHAMHIDATEITERSGIRVTTAARTIADCAQLLGIDQVAAMLREARHRRCLDLGALRAYCDPGRRRHGAPVLRAAIERFTGGAVGYRSALERSVRECLVARGAPEPVVNLGVSTSIGTVETDQAWPELRVCVEVDGPTHDLPEQQEIDRRTRQALRAAGWTLCTVHWRAFEGDPVAATDPVLAAIRAAMERLAAATTFPT